MIAEDVSEAGHERPLRRIFGNLAWLVGGKGFGAVCSLVYLAILSRSLGLRDFGHFSLIFGTAQAIVALAGFQTWQAVVRFGTPHLAAERWGAVSRIALLAGLIDAAGALLGSLIAFVCLFVFAGQLSLNPDFTTMAFIFICVFVCARGSAPLGILRLFDRYDLAVKAGAFAPAARLLAATLIWLTGPSVGRFLFAWASIEIVTFGLYWTLALRRRPGALSLPRPGHWRGALAENPGILRFMGITYCASSAQAVLQQGPLLAVGYLLGTSAAGAYRLADQLARGLSKLSGLMAQALYPEVNRQHHAATAAQFRKLVVRLSLMVLAVGPVVVAIAYFLGDDLLALIGGSEFARAGAVLVPLAVAASIDLAGVSYESVLHSTGRTAWPLYARLLAIVALGVGITLFAGIGSVGVGWAVALATAAGYLVTSGMVAFALRRMDAPGTPVTR